MKKNRIWTGYAILLLLALCSASGCASKPTVKVAQAKELYASTLETLTLARKLGQIDDATALKIEEYRVLARQSLDTMDAAVKSGDTVALENATQFFSTAINQLLAWQVKTQKKE